LSYQTTSPDLPMWGAPRGANKPSSSPPPHRALHLPTFSHSYIHHIHTGAPMDLRLCIAAVWWPRDPVLHPIHTRRMHTCLIHPILLTRYQHMHISTPHITHAHLFTTPYITYTVPPPLRLTCRFREETQTVSPSRSLARSRALSLSLSLSLLSLSLSHALTHARESEGVYYYQRSPNRS